MTQKTVADVAKEQLIAYNEKDWDRARAAFAPEVVYDEVGTQRRVKGVDDLLTAWKGWAKAIPDSRATFQSEMVSGNTAVLEITWNGTPCARSRRIPAIVLSKVPRPERLRRLMSCSCCGPSTLTPTFTLASVRKSHHASSISVPFV